MPGRWLWAGLAWWPRGGGRDGTTDLGGGGRRARQRAALPARRLGADRPLGRPAPRGLAGLPLGTLAVNLSGCLAIGLLAGLFEQRLASPGLRLFLLVGVLGGFTTFSTFGLETQRLLEEGSLALAAANAGLSLGGGLLGVLLGLALGRWI
ncbi:MAG: CrcB family protein [Thermoanaerobaculia bacterium]|nr:CrcB family protein [Thermoanaerobaculia bacterium]